MNPDEKKPERCLGRIIGSSRHVRGDSVLAHLDHGSMDLVSQDSSSLKVGDSLCPGAVDLMG